MENLPENILFSILDSLSLEEIILLCSKNQYLRKSVLQNEDFWQHRYLQNYERPAQKLSSWKTAFRRKNGPVYVCGWNIWGGLGLGDTEKREVPTVIPNLHNIKNISSGWYYSLMLDVEGRVYAFGSNARGQLGVGNKSLKEVKNARISFDFVKIKKISTGIFHSLILDEHGQVWAFGDNMHGQLGLGDKENRYIPTPIPNLPKMKSISAGYTHSLLLSEEGHVYFCGTIDSIINELQHHFIPTLIPDLPRIKKISAGFSHSLILEEDGKVWSFGSNECGQLGLGHTNRNSGPACIEGLPKIKKIFAGKHHSLILDEHGQVYNFGSHRHQGNFSELSVPTPISYFQNIKSISTHTRRESLFLSEEGHVYMRTDSDPPYKKIDVPRALKISIHEAHWLILADSNE